jgi:antitoxin VapB
MERAKLFMNGRSQALRLPKDCRFDGDEVLVNRIGDMLVVMPAARPFSAFKRGVARFAEDRVPEAAKDTERRDL